MKSLLIMTLALLPAWAQALNFNLDAVAAKAKEKAEITLERPLLEQAMKSAPDKLKGKMGNVNRGVLRHYEFDKPGQYADSDVDSVRKIVSSGPGWARLINIKEEKER